MKPVLVLSPHLDDAVLSAGQFLAGRPGSTVLTIFAGIPSKYWPTTDYDRKAGFDTSEDAMVVRRGEDEEALAMLQATPIHLDFYDAQYQAPNDLDAIVDAVRDVQDVIVPEFVLAPLGLVHADHLVTAAVAGALSGPVIFYEELPYRVQHPQLAVKRANGLTECFIGDGPRAAKLSALWCYQSQMALPEFTNIHSALVPERFWS